MSNFFGRAHQAGIADVVLRGADPSGVQDATAIIQQAIDAMAAAGGGKVWLAGTFKISAALRITAPGVKLAGLGAGGFHVDGSKALGGSKLVWAGADDASAAMIRVAPPAATAYHLDGNAIEGISLDCASLAGIGLEIRSARNFDLDVAVYEAKTWGIYFACVDTLTSDTISTQGGRGRMIVRQIETANGGGICFDGSQTEAVYGNASFNAFDFIDIQVKTGDGLVFKSSDNNLIRLARVLRVAGGSGGKDVRFQGSDGVGSPPIPGVARGNLIQVLSASASGIHIEGTELWANPSHDNVILALDKENATPDPALGTGPAGSFFSFFDGLWKIGPAGQWNFATQELRAIGGKNLSLLASAGNSVTVGTVSIAKTSVTAARRRMLTGSASFFTEEWALAATTTDATPTQALADDGVRIGIAANTSVSFRAQIVGSRTDGGGTESSGWIVEGVIRNTAGTLAFAGGGAPAAVVTQQDAAAATWAVAVSADSANDALVFTVTGEVNKTIKWAIQTLLAGAT